MTVISGKITALVDAAFISGLNAGSFTYSKQAEDARRDLDEELSKFDLTNPVLKRAKLAFDADKPFRLRNGLRLGTYTVGQSNPPVVMARIPGYDELHCWRRDGTSPIKSEWDLINLPDDEETFVNAMEDDFYQTIVAGGGDADRLFAITRRAIQPDTGTGSSVASRLLQTIQDRLFDLPSESAELLEVASAAVDRLNDPVVSAEQRYETIAEQMSQLGSDQQQAEDLRAVSRCIGLAMQGHEFGRYIDGDWTCTAGQLAGFTDACNQAAKSICERHQERFEEFLKCKAENERFRQALEWYAEEVLTYSITQHEEPRSAAHADKGKRARAALAGSEG